MEPPHAKPLVDDMEALGTGTRLIALSAEREHMSGKPVITPIYHSSTYYSKTCQDFANQITKGYAYSRVRTVNSDELELAISQVEHAAGTVVFASGMGAIFNTLMCFLKPGDHVVVHKPLYTCTEYVLNNMMPKYNIEVTYVDAAGDIQEYEKATKPNTALYYGETVCNPMMHYLDVEGLGKLGRANNILTMVDATFTSPINQRPLDYGIDMVIHSCTKYMGGHSDLLAGCTSMKTVEHYSELKNWLVYSGACQSAFDAVLLLRSLRTLHLRMEKHNANGLMVAKYLEKHPKVKKVHYLGLDSHPGHELASTTMKGFGGMISLEFDNLEDSRTFCESTKIFRLAVSLGGAESLIEHVTSMTHGSWTGAAVEGIPSTLVRISVGLEDSKDQIADLEQAFTKIK